ncbi:hypothetical protein [Geminocystis sp. NIES-3709]|uniref:hypothetical protein n=1 Tax=Geminocystis sp. NIES-3709 TaxID=1617448 RepID=UPI0005FCCA83|nr:hypothetical protein [Geminocystis sp. NIES-3709]BAQ65527.1 hypothetical protein GM3709_2292 [Geminocystis sp. NIES-3709]
MRTVTIRNNEARSITVRYVGGKGEVSFSPGINLFVPEQEWNFIKVHPVVKVWLEKKVLDILKSAPETEGNLEGFEVSTRSEDDQPIPHLPAKLGSNSLKPNRQESKISIADLTQVTVKEAEEIITKSFDREELIKLQTQDSRKGIQQAITLRLQELNDDTVL